MIAGLLAVGLWGSLLMLHELWLVVASALFAVVIWRRTLGMLFLMFAAGMIVGIYRGGVELYAAAPIKTLVGKVVELEGRVSDDPQVDKKGQMILRLDAITMQGEPLAGKIWVSAEKNDTLRRSDRVVVRGKVNDGFGSFALTMYRASLLSASRLQPGDMAVQIRDNFADMVRRYIPLPEVDLGLGFLLGQKRALSNELMQTLQIAGLTHIVVASGYNLTILVRLMRRLLAPISKYLAFISAASLVLGFMAITGMSPSIARAGLVAGLSLLAWYYGRRFHPVMLLVMSAAVTAMIEPSFLWGDVGWYLSFAAFAGVMIVAPLLYAYFWGKKDPNWLTRIVVETFSAQIVALPIILMLFGSFSLLSIVANVLILPLVPLVMLLVFLTGITSFMPLVANVLGWSAHIVLSYMIWVAELVANQQWAVFEITLSPLMLATIYGVLFLTVMYLLRITKYRLRDASIVE